MFALSVNDRQSRIDWLMLAALGGAVGLLFASKSPDRSGAIHDRRAVEYISRSQILCRAAAVWNRGASRIAQPFTRLSQRAFCRREQKLAVPSV